MSPKPVIIQEGAFIVSDAHYSHLRPELLYFLREIHSKNMAVPQLILMGDIFDALFGSIDFTCKQNKEVIALINDISKDTEVVYLEGNHDFNIKNVFPKAKVFSIKNQPVEALYQKKKVYLAHGDFDGDRLYKLYTSLIRSPFVLFVLKYIDIFSKHAILKNLDSYLSKKNDCKKFTGFREFVQKRLAEKYTCDYFIEGHYHQNTSFGTDGFYYINLGAFACNQRYFIVKSAQDIELLEEKKYSREI
ncbi:UDP-2,3-diacylglucosamine hydrolase [Sulfurimonas sediminis]|uniref:UDP-2,3-diacylglucosamine hydrolase n=1 Tax=Sulfurimonas sediminis TaxID=2590020 RepID=A0A7M1B310_9BACT|nr:MULTISPECIES: metallophosphoesterase [Sulfurimonas]QOP43062.1 UDP-2,3-diacylglucosamine hydrolase [Sulfurimonas sediminis]UCN00952.1 metallophosphoesterase family protein [Sulfurimonas sp. SWIR-19]